MGNGKQYLLSFTTFFNSDKGYTLAFNLHEKFEHDYKYHYSFLPWSRFDGLIMDDMKEGRTKVASGILRPDIKVGVPFDVEVDMLEELKEVGLLNYLVEINDYLQSEEVNYNDIMVEESTEAVTNFYDRLAKILDTVDVNFVLNVVKESGTVVTVYQEGEEANETIKVLRFNQTYNVDVSSYNNSKLIDKYSYGIEKGVETSNVKNVYGILEYKGVDTRKEGEEIHVEEGSDRKITEDVEVIHSEMSDTLKESRIVEESVDYEKINSLGSKDKLVKAERLMKILYGDRVIEEVKSKFNTVFELVKDKITSTITKLDSNFSEELQETRSRKEATIHSYMEKSTTLLDSETISVPIYNIVRHVSMEELEGNSTLVGKVLIEQHEVADNFKEEVVVTDELSKFENVTLTYAVLQLVNNTDKRITVYVDEFLSTITKLNADEGEHKFIGADTKLDANVASYLETETKKEVDIKEFTETDLSLDTKVHELTKSEGTLSTDVREETLEEADLTKSGGETTATVSTSHLEVAQHTAKDFDVKEYIESDSLAYTQEEKLVLGDSVKDVYRHILKNTNSVVQTIIENGLEKTGKVDHLVDLRGMETTFKGVSEVGAEITDLVDYGKVLNTDVTELNEFNKISKFYEVSVIGLEDYTSVSEVVVTKSTRAETAKDIDVNEIIYSDIVEETVVDEVAEADTTVYSREIIRHIYEKTVAMTMHVEVKSKELFDSFAKEAHEQRTTAIGKNDVEVKLSSYQEHEKMAEIEVERQDLANVQNDIEIERTTDVERVEVEIETNKQEVIGGRVTKEAEVDKTKETTLVTVWNTNQEEFETAFTHYYETVVKELTKQQTKIDVNVEEQEPVTSRGVVANTEIGNVFNTTVYGGGYATINDLTDTTTIVDTVVDNLDQSDSTGAEANVTVDHETELFKAVDLQELVNTVSNFREISIATQDVADYGTEDGEANLDREIQAELHKNVKQVHGYKLDVARSYGEADIEKYLNLSSKVVNTVVEGSETSNIVTETEIENSSSRGEVITDADVGKYMRDATHFSGEDVNIVNSDQADTTVLNGIGQRLKEGSTTVVEGKIDRTQDTQVSLGSTEIEEITESDKDSTFVTHIHDEVGKGEVLKTVINEGYTTGNVQYFTKLHEMVTKAEHLGVESNNEKNIFSKILNDIEGYRISEAIQSQSIVSVVDVLGTTEADLEREYEIEVHLDNVRGETTGTDVSMDRVEQMVTEEVEVVTQNVIEFEYKGKEVEAIVQGEDDADVLGKYAVVIEQENSSTSVEYGALNVDINKAYQADVEAVTDAHTTAKDSLFRVAEYVSTIVANKFQDIDVTVTRAEETSINSEMEADTNESIVTYRASSVDVELYRQVLTKSDTSVDVSVEKDFTGEIKGLETVVYSDELSETGKFVGVDIKEFEELREVALLDVEVSDDVVSDIEITNDVKVESIEVSGFKVEVDTILHSIGGAVVDQLLETYTQSNIVSNMSKVGYVTYWDRIEKSNKEETEAIIPTQDGGDINSHEEIILNGVEQFNASETLDVKVLEFSLGNVGKEIIADIVEIGGGEDVIKDTHTYNTIEVDKHEVINEVYEHRYEKEANRFDEIQVTAHELDQATQAIEHDIFVHDEEHGKGLSDTFTTVVHELDGSVGSRYGQDVELDYVEDFEIIQEPYDTAITETKGLDLALQSTIDVFVIEGASNDKVFDITVTVAEVSEGVVETEVAEVSRWDTATTGDEDITVHEIQLGRFIYPEIEVYRQEVDTGELVALYDAVINNTETGDINVVVDVGKESTKTGRSSSTVDTIVYEIDSADQTYSVDIEITSTEVSNGIIKGYEVANQVVGGLDVVKYFRDTIIDDFTEANEGDLQVEVIKDSMENASVETVETEVYNNRVEYSELVDKSVDSHFHKTETSITSTVLDIFYSTTDKAIIELMYEGYFTKADKSSHGIFVDGLNDVGEYATMSVEVDADKLVGEYASTSITFESVVESIEGSGGIVPVTDTVIDTDEQAQRDKRRRITIDEEDTADLSKKKEIIIYDEDNAERHKNREIILDNEETSERYKNREIIVEEDENSDFVKSRRIVLDDEENAEFYRKREARLDKEENAGFSKSIVIEINDDEGSTNYGKRNIIEIVDEDTGQYSRHRTIEVIEEDSSSMVKQREIEVVDLDEGKRDKVRPIEIVKEDEGLIEKTRKIEVVKEDAGDIERIRKISITEEDTPTKVTGKSIVLDEEDVTTKKPKEYIGDVGDDDLGEGKLPEDKPQVPKEKKKIWLIMGKPFPAWNGWNPKKTR